MTEVRKQKVKSCRQETDRSLQKTFAPWCFPAWLSQASSAERRCGEQHTMLLCPHGRHHSSQHTTAHYGAQLPRPQLRVPKYCPLLSTHTLSPALVARPEATDSQRGHRLILGVTHMKARAHTHTINLQEDEHTPSY